MPIGDYLNKEKASPYCKGCGHIHIDRSLAYVLDQLALDPKKVVVVSDIGCLGLADYLLKTHTVHTTHGRSPAFAAGIELADSLYGDSGLKTIVMIGDGGATIGLLHLVELARMNPDVTVLLHNNYLYGMTGGQHSGFTPLNFVTSTTRQGNFIPPMDICGMLSACDAGFLARIPVTDQRLTEIIAQAISYPGFALVEIIELCTGYATRYNKLTMKRFEADLKRRGIPLGVLRQIQDKKEFSLAYRERLSPVPSRGESEDEIPRLFSHQLKAPLRLMIGGTAGEGVQSSSHIFTLAAALSGLFTSQKNDNPVTVGTGFSTSELIFSPEEILFTGISRPDAVLITSLDGLERLEGVLDRMTPEGVVMLDDTLPTPRTQACVVQIPFRSLSTSLKQVNLSAIASYLKHHPFMPIDALQEAIRREGKGVDEALQTLERGYKETTHAKK